MKEYLTPMGLTPLDVNPIFEIGPVAQILRVACVWGHQRRQEWEAALP